MDSPDCDCGGADCDCFDFCAGAAVGSTCGGSGRGDGCGAFIVLIFAIFAVVGFLFYFFKGDTMHEYKILQVKEERHLFIKDSYSTIEDVKTGERKVVRGTYGEVGDTFKHDSVFK